MIQNLQAHLVKNLDRNITSSKHFLNFLDLFLNRLDSQDIDALPQDEFTRIFECCWNFIQDFKGQDAKIQIKTFCTNEILTINILNRNSPFLVDSLVGYLEQFNLKAQVLVHPVMKVERRSGGGLISLEPASHGTPNDRCESFIHCQISDPISQDVLEQIHRDLPKVFEDVKCAVQDWAGLKQKLKTYLKGLDGFQNVLPQEKITEIKDFLHWLEDHNFTFIGYRKFIDLADNGFQASDDTEDNLGILSLDRHKKTGIIQHSGLNEKTLEILRNQDPIIISKTSQLSRVHRTVPLDALYLKEMTPKGEVTCIHQFLGLFTSLAYNTSSRDIPLLKQKVSRIIEKSPFSSDWHEAKALLHLIDTLPRDELFQANEDQLLDLVLKGLRTQERPKLLLNIRQDIFHRFLSCLIYIPRKHFKYEITDRIREILSEEFDLPVNLRSAEYGSFALARIHYLIFIPDRNKVSYNFERLEKKLAECARSWDEDFLQELNKKFGSWEGHSLFKTYRKAFSKGYQEHFLPSEGAIDLKYMEKAYQTNEVQLRLYRPDGMAKNMFRLKCYNVENFLPLSDILPLFKNLDLEILGENPFLCTPGTNREKIWVHDFEARSRGQCGIELEQIQKNFLEAFRQIYSDSIENDGFNRLVLRAHLTWRECIVIRAYNKLLRQMRSPFSEGYIIETLIKNSNTTRYLYDLFATRFDPSRTENRNEKQIYDKILKNINDVESPDEDIILRRYAHLILATVRTNYFQFKTCDPLPYLTLKLQTERLEEAPIPRPKYEIFVYSPRFEAIHLRGGKIARGGIRWSDRREDFRTEILDLMKAQMVKNAIIVPHGAKGGFVLKRTKDCASRQDVQKEGVACYKLMITAFLEVTDNLQGEEVIKPKNMVCYDDDDPYFVVAADKGTATFSDYANQISAEKNFWLKDAFASGGSSGYDHKKMGITARGAWESVKSHFYILGKDIQKEDISVVGVGDMGGDVFGNGLLLSRHIRLVAAFNHKHIFIDPHPDPEKSFEERQRLFDAVLGWDHYDRQVLSKGGGIYDLHGKYVDLSREACELLELPKDEKLKPEIVIQAILKGAFDLLWFGGIGTFVKSKTESHTEVGDHANDRIRINAHDLRCTVIGEGANLGITQLGRIDFAQKGGFVNMDAVDNAGGVNCSDHEVNLKILMNAIQEKESLSESQRNDVLESMTGEVTDLVLKDNRDQNEAINLIQSLGSMVFDAQVRLIHELDKSGKLNREIEYLPDDLTLEDYSNEQKLLSRPELSIVLSYAKLALYEDILKGDLIQDTYFTKYLMAYFPKIVEEKYADYAFSHPLKKQIISTMVCNQVLNTMGGSFVLDLMEKSHRCSEDVLRAYFITQEIFDLEVFWARIENLPKLEHEKKMLLRVRIWTIVKRITKWFLREFKELPFEEISQRYREGVKELEKDIPNCMDQDMREAFDHHYDFYQTQGVDHEFAMQLAQLETISSSPDIILISLRDQENISNVAVLYFCLGSRFQFHKAREIGLHLKSNTAWHRSAASLLIEDFYHHQRALTERILDFRKSKNLDLTGQDLLDRWSQDHASLVKYSDKTLGAAVNVNAPDLASLVVIQKTLRTLSFDI